MTTESKTDSELQAIPIASLRIGLQLPIDIYDDKNILLLTKGSVVTPRLLRNLLERNRKVAFMRNADVHHFMPQAAPTPSGGYVDLETDQTRALDAEELADARTEGVALMESFKPRNAIPYDTELVDELIKSHDSDVRDLSAKLAGLVEGSNKIAGSSIEEIATRYIRHICQDVDATLSIAQVPRKNNYIANHSLKVAVLGMALGAQLGLTQKDVHIVGISGLLNDIGMAKVPLESLNAVRPLTKNERWEMMKHPIYALDMMEKVRGISSRCELIVFQVHERHNGKGYPRNRTGNQTYNLSKALGIADAYLAMINDRPFRQALLPYHAMAQILKEAKEGYWDPKIVRAFLKLIGLFPVGSFVMLNNGSLAKVIRSGGDELTKPHVSITHNPMGIAQKSDTVIDLAEEPEGQLAIAKAIPPVYNFTTE